MRDETGKRTGPLRFLDEGRTRRRVAAVGAIVAVVLISIAVVTDPFSGGSSPSRGASDNGAPTAIGKVTRESLSSQTQVSGTLGYAGSLNVNLPAGTAPSAVSQAQQTYSSAQETLSAARSTLSADRQTLVQAQSQLGADRRKQASDCAGAAAADSAGNGGSDTGSGGSASTPCAAAIQTVAGDEVALASAKHAVATDQVQIENDQGALTGAQQSLASAESSAATYENTSTYTMLPAAGKVIRRGQVLYEINEQPSLLLYGPVTAWRAFRAGMSPGRDVAELNANLEALGYGQGLTGDSFSSPTEQAIVSLQAANRMDQTGVLALGSVAFMPGPVRVTSATPTVGQASATPTVGQAVQAGAVLAVTSTRHEVAIELDAAQQSQVAVGDKVTVTLPDNSTTPGVVSTIGKVATTPSTGGDQGNGGSSTPTIEVDVKLLHEAAAGELDQAPVNVEITTASVSNVLVVPVNALLALTGGGYAVEAVSPSGAHQLLRVTLGLFDDVSGMVQVSGAGLHKGLRVVVAAS
jgi:hypothetical protein